MHAAHPDNLVCTYCQSTPAEELDHTMPRSWFPDGTSPAEVQRVTVPSCKRCGAALKKAEEQVALALMMAKGFDRDHPAAVGVFQRVRKTWNAAAAKTPRERQHRAKRMMSVIARVQAVVVPPEVAVGSVLVKARTPAGLFVDAALAVKFRRTDFDSVAEKFVRGLHYHGTKTTMPAGTKFTAFEPDEESTTQAAQLPGGMVSDGLFYGHIESEDGDGRAIWFFLLWGQVKIGVLVEPPTAPLSGAAR